MERMQGFVVVFFRSWMMDTNVLHGYTCVQQILEMSVHM